MPNGNHNMITAENCKIHGRKHSDRSPKAPDESDNAYCKQSLVTGPKGHQSEGSLVRKFFSFNFFTAWAVLHSSIKSSECPNVKGSKRRNKYNLKTMG